MQRCTSTRINFSSNRTCPSLQTSQNETIKINDRTYKYTNANFTDNIEGYYQTYDDSGYYFDVDITTPLNFYNDMNALINNGWINDSTKSILLLMNSYNRNYDSVVTYKRLGERIGNFFQTIEKFNVININPTINIYTIIALVFSILSIVFMVLILNSKSKKKDNKLERNRFNIPFKEKMKKFFIGLKNFFVDNFRSPNFFEIISKFIK